MKKLVKHWRILSYFFFTPVFLLISIALTVINTVSARWCDFHEGQINPGTFGTALTSHCSGHSGSSILRSCSLSDSTSPAQLSSLSFGLSKSPFQLSQSAVSQMLSGGLLSSVSTGWRLILQIRRTSNIWVCPPGRYFAETGGCKRELSDNLNTATRSCWESNQGALNNSSVSEMYPTWVICLFRAQDPFWVAHRFWLPCYISKKSWTLAILCNFLPSA